MNAWTCNAHGCRSIAIGVGGAVGLRAIGWYFVPGGTADCDQHLRLPIILCPGHRPDPIKCKEIVALLECPLCRAEDVASELQKMIADRR